MFDIRSPHDFLHDMCRRLHRPLITQGNHPGLTVRLWCNVLSQNRDREQHPFSVSILPLYMYMMDWLLSYFFSLCRIQCGSDNCNLTWIQIWNSRYRATNELCSSNSFIVSWRNCWKETFAAHRFMFSCDFLLYRIFRQMSTYSLVVCLKSTSPPPFQISTLNTPNQFVILFFWCGRD